MTATATRITIIQQPELVIDSHVTVTVANLPKQSQISQSLSSVKSQSFASGRERQKVPVLIERETERKGDRKTKSANSVMQKKVSQGAKKWPKFYQRETEGATWPVRASSTGVLAWLSQRSPKKWTKFTHP
jgi:hypothetical protein